MSRPNVIVVLCDDLGYGDLGCYGSSVNRTPRLDQMARDGMLLTDFYMASPVCSPSRAALLTGCYPKRIGLDSGQTTFPVLLPGDQLGLSAEETTIASLLRSVGYRTKLIGKWHLGDQPPFLPSRHGFDSYFGLPFSNDMLPDHPENAHFRFPPLPLMRDDEVVETDPNQATLTYRYTAEAVDFIRTSSEAGHPFFLYFAHMYVHVPIYVPMRYLSRSENGSYGAAVDHVDDVLGVLLDTLDELGIAEETLVVFSSDNGAPAGPLYWDLRGSVVSNGALRGGKGDTWEGGMRVPCLVRWQNVIPAGAVCRELVSAMDLLPTIADLAGLSGPERTIDGEDIGPLLLGEPGAVSPHEAFFYYGTGDHSLHAVRSGRWKLHLIRNELYDLETDIAESRNVIAQHPEVVTRLRALADRCRNELGDASSGVEGTGCRAPGWVDRARTLTTMDALPPLLRALYD